VISSAITLAKNESRKLLTADRADPEREAYLRRFVDQESRVYLNRFYRIYRGRSPDEALRSWRIAPGPSRGVWPWSFNRSGREAGRAALGAFLARHLPRDSISDDDLWDLYRKYNPSQFSLQDRGYLAGIHPLELWLVAYLQHHPGAPRARGYRSQQRRPGKMPMPGSSRAAADTSRACASVYCWNRTRSTGSCRTGQRQGYPFGHLVPSYGSAIGQLRRPARRARRFDRHNSQ